MLQVSTHTEPGFGHVNQDAILVERHPLDNGVWLCALADGQGGQMGAAEAARTAVEANLSNAASRKPKKLRDASKWYEAIAAADGAVAANPEAGFTTLVCLGVVDGVVCGASSGDSAAILIQDGHVIHLTERQMKNPPVGSGGAYPVSFKEQLKAPWKLLVMSDGVWKYLGWDAVTDIVRSNKGKSMVEELRRITLEVNGGRLPDDFSVILLQEDQGESLALRMASSKPGKRASRSSRRRELR